MILTELGWSPFFEQAFSPFAGAGLLPARVAIQHRNYYVLATEHGDLRGQVTGKMEYFATGPADLPCVGDWVVMDARPEEGAATIVEILPRRTRFSRKIAGPKSLEQVLAANIDLVFVVTGLDRDFNLRRIERYLALCAESGADPIIILNKADLCSDQNIIRRELEPITGSVPVSFTSALNDSGLEVIRSRLAPGLTGALLGSSGVGKTTMINQLVGSERRPTQPVREHDSRGRHTTSARELIPLPSGGLLIDTPGLRELQLWGTGSGIREAFADIEDLASRCKFRDCSHTREPGCAIQTALDDETLDPERYASYVKLKKELAYQNRKLDPAAQRDEKERIKKIMVAYRKRPKKGRP